MKNFLVNRRTLLSGTAIGSLGLLAACSNGEGGGASSNAESASALGVGEDIAKLISVNPKEPSELKEGGEFRYALKTLGPDFNVATQSGNTTDNAVALSSVAPLMVAGLWVSDFEGKWTPNSDFCESFEEAEEGGKQVLHIKLNSKAKFNDGTPVDIKALQATAEILRDGLDKGFNLVDSGPHTFIEKIEENGDAFTVKVIMSKPYQPISNVFGYGYGVFHPAVNDKEVFNNGFVDNIHPEWQAGPFKVDNWNSSEKVLTIKPNGNWWGEKPILERIIIRQMETAAQRAAFKNGELDAIELRALTAYKEVDGQEGTEIRRGQRLFSGGMNMSSFRIPLEVRKAIFAATDRAAIGKIRFNGLNWTENVPGSLMLLPFSKYYVDNYTKATEGWEASKILEEAGYKKDGDYYKKDGKELKYSITTFGDDPVDSAIAQAFVQQMKTAGIEFTIDNQPDANFGTVVGNKEFDLTFSGYSVGSDATTVVKQYYNSKNNKGNGSKEIDRMIEEAGQIKDNAERMKKCNEIEQKHMSEFAMIGTTYNGPEMIACRKELANFGAALFGNVNMNPQAWLKVGFIKA